jgi:hypothetical protein
MEEDDGALVLLTSPSDKLSNANSHHARVKKCYFVNPTWLVTERVLDVDESIDMKADASTWPLAEEMVKEGSKFKILVKWQGLPYSLATWELAAEVPDPMAVTEAIQMFFKREMQSFTGKSRSGNRDQHKSKEDISNGLPVQFENGGALRDYQVCWCCCCCVCVFVLSHVSLKKFDQCAFNKISKTHFLSMIYLYLYLYSVTVSLGCCSTGIAIDLLYSLMRWVLVKPCKQSLTSTSFTSLISWPVLSS